MSDDEKVIVPIRKREEYMIGLLKELYGFLGSYYLDVFKNEEVNVSPCCSIVDLRKNSIRMHYLHFYEDVLYWTRFLEGKSLMRKK